MTFMIETIAINQRIPPGELPATPDDIDLELARRRHKTAEDLRALVDRAYGEVAEQTFAETQKKAFTLAEELAMLEELKNNWDAIWQDVSGYLRSRGELEAALEAAGAPTRPADLDFTPDDIRNAIQYARLMRNRYTILDLTDSLGWLDRWLDMLVEDFAS